MATLDWASIDAASCSGLAIWRGDRLISTQRIKIKKGAAGWSVWEPVLQGLDGVVIEGGYVGKGLRSSVTLAETRGKIIGYAEASGAEVWGEMLQPAEWRKIVGIKGNLKRAQQKLAASRMCNWLRAEPALRMPCEPWDAYHLPNIGRTADEEEAALIGAAWLRLTEKVSAVPVAAPLR